MSEFWSGLLHSARCRLGWGVNGLCIFLVFIFSSLAGLQRCLAQSNEPPGAVDSTFDPGTGAQSEDPYYLIETLDVQGDGRVIIAGGFTSYNAVNRARIARLHPDGSLDLSFDPGLGADGLIRTAKILSNGKILIGGDFASGRQGRERK